MIPENELKKMLLNKDDIEDEETSRLNAIIRTLSIDSGTSDYTQHAFLNDDLLRTKSQRIDDIDAPTGMRPSHKNYVSGTYVKGEKVDAMKIAVFSQEGTGHFSKSFHPFAKHSKNMWSVDEKDNLYNKNALTGKKNKLLNNINIKGTKFNTQPEVLNSLLKDKDIPTVIAVIEGNRADLNPVVKIKTAEGKVRTYLLADTHMTGHNVNQTMNFYVRKNMKNGVEIKEVEIPATNKEGEKSSFMVGQISFTAGTGAESKQYSTLVTHIPNEFVGNELSDDLTHQAIMDYAKAQTDRTVVAYTGDTNYTKKMGKFTLLAAGGNAGDVYVTPPNSTQVGKLNKSNEPEVTRDGKLKDRSFFMQTVPLMEADKSFSVSQPSMLNLVRPNYKNKTDTDHPSMMTYVPLSAKLNRTCYVNACAESAPKREVRDPTMINKRSLDEMNSKPVQLNLEKVASETDEIESAAHTKKSIQILPFSEANREKAIQFKDRLINIKSKASNIEEETAVEDKTSSVVINFKTL